MRIRTVRETPISPVRRYALHPIINGDRNENPIDGAPCVRPIATRRLVRRRKIVAITARRMVRSAVTGHGTTERNAKGTDFQTDFPMAVNLGISIGPTHQRRVAMLFVATVAVVLRRLDGVNGQLSTVFVVPWDRFAENVPRILRLSFDRRVIVTERQRKPLTG